MNEIKEARPYHDLGLTDEFAELARYLGKVKAAQDKLKAEEERTIAAVLEIIGKLPVSTSVSVDHYRVTLGKGRTTRKLDPVKLLELGVSSKVIQQATSISTGQPTLVFTDTSKARKPRALPGEDGAPAGETPTLDDLDLSDEAA